MTDKQKILIVDDRKENLVALRQVLSGVDAEIVEAATGNEALAATLNHEFAVAILDVQMPEMNGYELAEHLREDKKTQMMPIMFVTAAYADEEHKFLGYEAGGVDYLTKPYSPDIMLAKVKVFLELARNRKELEIHRDQLETLVAERTGQLGEKVKELKCLYAVSGLVAEPCKSITDTLRVALDLISPGWRYPEITRARIVFEGREFAADGFRDTPWKISTNIVVSGKKLGSVEVCYLEEKPALDEGPFLKEERDQINEIARQLGVMIGRKSAEAALQAKNEELNTVTQQLWQAAKLATMGELASSIAHELNNPLATVSLRVESLIAQCAGDDPRRRELEIIGQEVERMGNLVTNLLQFSRRSHKQISTVDIREETEKTLELIHYHLRKNNIEVSREFAPDVPGILADRQQLKQLFLNLFTNASDAMPKGGKLTIRVAAQPEEKKIFIEIADTGVGIPPEILPKAMEPFYTTKPEGKGTGLGLAICRRIVEEQGGTFDIESEGIPGKGTKVRITLQSMD